MNIQWLNSATAAVFGIVAASIPACISYYFAKRQQRESDQRKWKIDVYTEYIKGITITARSPEDPEGQEAYAHGLNKTLLIGSAETARAAMNLFSYHNNPTQQQEDTRNGGPQRTSLSSEENDRLFTDLYRAMREDLYGKKVNIGLPTIRLACARRYRR